MANEKSTTAKGPSGFKILMIVGIVLAALCVVGILVQTQAYAEYAGKSASGVQTAAGGARASLVQALSAWSGSSSQEASTAYNLLGFFWIALAFSVLLIIWGIRGMHKSSLPESQAPTFSRDPYGRGGRSALDARYLDVDPEHEPDSPFMEIPTPPRMEIRPPSKSSSSRRGNSRRRY